MPRPPKKRYVCCEPYNHGFIPNIPTDNGETKLSVDAYETIRLIDLEGLTQAECARQMGVSRTTVQSMYNTARYQIADALVHAKRLTISGGDYVLHNHFQTPCGKGCQKKQCLHLHCQTQREESCMKIAVTYENGTVFQHFGHTRQFKLYQVTGHTIEKTALLDTTGSGHGALAKLLSAHGVDTLICGGIGGGARTALAQENIKIYPGVSGNADQNVQALLDGSLRYDPDTTCDHHHENGHSCGHHSCGEDKHGCAGN